MASSFVKCSVFLAALILFSELGCKLEAAVEEDMPYPGLEGEDLSPPSLQGEDEPSPYVEGEESTQIVSKALLCFNEKAIYSSCEESYRLTDSGNLNVPPSYTDEYCSGPCLTETNLVLDCVGEILSNFKFFNKATIEDIRSTIHAACSYGSERGDFNVAEHLSDESRGDRGSIPKVLFGLLLMINYAAWFAMKLLL